MASSVSLVDRLSNLPQYLLPQRLLGALTYRLTRIRARWFKNRFIAAFSAYFKVDLSEATEPDPLAYEHFNAFFTRTLRPEVRPIDGADDSFCCPVDGAVSQAGAIAGDSIFQAKGREFSLTALLGGEAELAQPYLGGGFATLYLSPRDYHRIHMPLAGELRQMLHIPGKLFSVSPLTTRAMHNLFARNERVVNIFDTAVGPMALVMVGAINVGSMETVWAGVLPGAAKGAIQRNTYPESGNSAVRLAKGAEMGRFNMGSTVILLLPKDSVAWQANVVADATVKMGQRLGRIV